MKTLFKSLPFELTAALIAVTVSATALVSTFGIALFMLNYTAHHPSPAASAPAPSSLRPTPSALISQGHHLFLMNCAHCHADDATGDEGPDLHRVKKSDARIGAIIKNGIKGEMPKFGQKLNDADVKALTAFLRSLN